MLSGYYYHYIFLIIVSFVTIVTVHYYMSLDDLRKEKTKIPAFILLIIIVFFVGLRPIDNVFVDMFDASIIMDLRQGQDFLFNWDTDNIIHDNIFNYWCHKEYPKAPYFLIYSFIYFVGIYISIRKLFPENLLMAFVIYLGAFSTFSYGTNGIKAGAAASIFLIAIAYKEKWYISIPFLIISLGFHHSMTLPISAFIIASLFHNRKFFLAFWVICLVLAALHITYFQELFAGLTDEHGAEYLDLSDKGIAEKVKYVSGFRIDFILYSAVPIFLGYHLAEKHQIKSLFFDFLWCVYVLCNGVWLLCSYASYTNRIAYLSWLLYPIVLAYPFLAIIWKEDQYKYVKFLAWGHLGFTLFMTFVYYG